MHITPTNTTIFPEDLKEYLHNNTLIGIKGGRERDTFLNIWMVRVEDRIFSRSWNKSTTSWFTEFLKSGVGQIKYGETVLDVKGQKVSPEDEIQEKINLAYRAKYNQPKNLFYSHGITQPEYTHYTMEFFIDQNQL